MADPVVHPTDPANTEQLADDLARCQRRLVRQVELQRHWRERAIAAEQALGLYGLKESLDALLAKREKLLEAVAELQWGSCDGCGAHRFCPLCGAGKDEPHKPGCLARAALSEGSGEVTSPSPAPEGADSSNA